MEITTSGTGEARRAFTQTFINNPAWEEPLCMIAAHAADENEPIGSFLVNEASQVDVVFAARLAHLAGPFVWKRVGSELAKQLRMLYEGSNAHFRRCALAAMVATGSDEFADILLPLLTSQDQRVSLGTYRLGVEFHLSSLGPNWQSIVEGWPEQQRSEFVTESAFFREGPMSLSSLRRSMPAIVCGWRHCGLWHGWERGPKWRSCWRRFRISNWPP